MIALKKQEKRRTFLFNHKLSFVKFPKPSEILIKPYGPGTTL